MSDITVRLGIETGNAIRSIQSFRSQTASLLNGLGGPGGSAGLLGVGIAATAASAYAGAVNTAIDTVRGTVNAGFSMLADQLPNLYQQLGNRITEAMEAEGQRLSIGNTIKLATGKNLAESTVIGLQARRDLAKEAAVLPGESKDYNTIFTGLTDNFFKASKAAGITNTDDIIKATKDASVKLGIVQTVSKLTATDSNDFGNRFLGAGDIKRLEKSRFAKANPLLMSKLEDAILEQGVSLKDATLAQRLKAWNKAFGEFVNPEYLEKSKQLLESSTGDFVSKLIDPENGIFSFARILNMGEVSSSKDANRAKSALDGVKALMRTVADLVPSSGSLSFDIMATVREKLLALNDYIKQISKLDLGTGISTVLADSSRFVTDIVNNIGPYLVKGVNALFATVATFIESDGYQELRTAIMGLYNQIENAMNGPAAKKIMAEVLSIQIAKSISDFGRSFNTFMDVAAAGLINMIGDALKRLGQYIIDALINLPKDLITGKVALGSGENPSATYTALAGNVDRLHASALSKKQLATGNLDASVKSRHTDSDYGAPVTVNVHPSKGMDEKALGDHTVRKLKEEQAKQKRRGLG